MKLKSKTVKIGRNDLCPCGSGKKYKKCCMGKPEDPAFTSKSFFGDQVDINDKDKIRRIYERKYKIRLKDAHDVEKIRAAGRLTLSTLDLVEVMIKPGITTEDINTVVHNHIINNNAVPATLNYRGYPKSVCVSVNEVICHGIPGPYVLKDGDIVNVDVTPILDGYYADANKTYFVGTPSKDAEKIVHTAGESLRRGMAMVKPGNMVGDIGWAVQEYAEGEGCSVVREFVGHGVGFEFHEAPQIPHYGRRGEGIKLIPGMVFTIEPMINLGRKELKVLDDRWTAVTRDKSLSAQFEQTILVTEDGYESLTPYDLSST